MSDEFELTSAPAFETRIERVRLAQFAAGLHLSNPIHFDAHAARAAGYRDVVAPPGYVISNTVQPKNVKLGALGIEESRALAGEISFTHHGVICAGDELHGFTRLAGRRRVEGDRPRTLFTLETNIRNQNEELVLELSEIIMQSDLPA